MRLSILAALIALFAVLAAGGATPRAQAAPTITLQQVAAGFTQPVAIANAGDSRLFVAEQTGAIRIISGGGVLPADFLDVSGLICVGGRARPPGARVPPGISRQRPTSTSTTRRRPATSIIARYTVSAGDPNVANPASALVLQTISHPDFTNHNGGQLAFGPDGIAVHGHRRWRQRRRSVEPRAEPVEPARQDPAPRRRHRGTPYASRRTTRSSDARRDAGRSGRTASATRGASASTARRAT